MDYLSQSFQMVVRKNGGFIRRGNANKSSNRNVLYHKYSKPGHFIKECPMHNIGYKNYVKAGGVKGKIKDCVPQKFKKRANADYVIKKDLPTLGDSSSKSDQYHPKDASMMAIKDDNNIFNSF